MVTYILDSSAILRYLDGEPVAFAFRKSLSLTSRDGARQ